MIELLTSASSAVAELGQLLVSGPTGILTLSAAVLVGVLVLTAARRATRATIVLRSRTDQRVRTYQRRIQASVRVPQTDPDAAGRPRPRAPGRSCV